MNKLVSSILFLTVFISNLKGQTLPELYPLTVDKLIYYKENEAKFFYGGPISYPGGGGTKWVMYASIETQKNHVDRSYEIAFVNCVPETAKDAKVYFCDFPEINIKFKNNLVSDYRIFSSLLSKGDGTKKVVIRPAEVAMFYYPDLHVTAFSTENLSPPIDLIEILSKKFGTEKRYTGSYKTHSILSIEFEDEKRIVFAPIEFRTENNQSSFILKKQILKNDKWKVYYIISAKNSCLTSNTTPPLIRLDSGCVSGQIYQDESCDCLDQLHEALSLLETEEYVNGIICHIPAHDGRGFGSAPKAETEIYKQGGRGRVHITKPLDTIKAAQLLYATDQIELRTFDGAANIIKEMGFDRVRLLTDNKLKVQALQNQGISTERVKTMTAKKSCLIHLQAKENSEYYYSK